jgi:subtilisin family serine protease
MPFDGMTGRGVKVAIIDSGVNPAHPHVGGVAGGVKIEADGESQLYLDYLGHGTAVAGAIREKAPEALLYAVKVFDHTLNTHIETIIRALEWCLAKHMHLVNLSLGTLNKAHRPRFERIVAEASKQGMVLVAAREMSGQDALPGSLPSVIGVGLDWECPRETYRYVLKQGRPVFMTSGYPRAIPGVSPERNLIGISFAVANMTGFVAQACQARLCAAEMPLETILIEEAEKCGSLEQ